MTRFPQAAALYVPVTQFLSLPFITVHRAPGRVYAARCTIFPGSEPNNKRRETEHNLFELDFSSLWGLYLFGLL